MNGNGNKLLSVLGEGDVLRSGGAVVTQNESGGFYDQLRNAAPVQSLCNELFDQVAAVLMGAYGIDGQQAGRLLDSKWGRHFSDMMTHERAQTREEFIEAARKTAEHKNARRHYADYISDDPDE